MTDPLAVVLAYHENTKHRPRRYARSLGYLDWASQPDPFRRFAGAKLLPSAQTEAAKIRGTGIGCYFDDSTHEVLGVTDDRFQVLYHFTMGGAVDDDRLGHLPPYAHLARS